METVELTRTDADDEASTVGQSQEQRPASIPGCRQVGRTAIQANQTEETPEVVADGPVTSRGQTGEQYYAIVRGVNQTGRLSY